MPVNLFLHSAEKKQALNITCYFFSTEQNKASVRNLFLSVPNGFMQKYIVEQKQAEKILVDVIKPFTEELLSEKLIDKFFFLRFHDTGHHIRIRFHGSQRN